jgi:RimJ/RimL family protein N-acetyltransferase
VVKILHGTTLLLRGPHARDVAERLALGHTAEIIHMFGGDPAAIGPMTLQDSQNFIDRLASHDHAWVIEHEGRFLGEIRLDALDMHDRRARLAIGLYDERRLGKGLGQEAVRLVLRYAFAELGLHRVGLRVVAYNLRAIRCYTACGFTEEGREREAALVAGQRYDDIMMGILAREFRAADQLAPGKDLPPVPGRL